MGRTLNRSYSAISTEIVPENVLAYSTKLSARLKELGFLYRSTGLTKLDIGFNQIQDSDSHEFISVSCFTSGSQKHRDLHKWALNRYVPNYKKIIKPETLVRYQRAVSQVRFLKNEESVYSDFLICWTPCGSETRDDVIRNNSWKYGIPVAAIAVASHSGVKVFNLKNPDALHRLYAFIQANYDLS